ncbi:MAG: sigma-70 family RNA polymerase sigma factor, partial [Gammaproteobacteria bacterium]|nr:sigma-70 family RNA polymerase sigma factor [Gammaproteobacteria bacterium]
MMTSNMMNDEILFSQFLKGDINAFENLYNRYRESLYTYLLRSSGNHAEADDIYQDAWSRVINARVPFTTGSFKAYIFKIARNLQIDNHRRSHLHLVGDNEKLEEMADSKPTMERQIDSEDCGERLLGEVAVLPREQRDAFLLKEESGLSLEQIATMLDVGRETIKSRLRYAMKRLREVLEDC